MRKAVLGVVAAAAVAAGVGVPLAVAGGSGGCGLPSYGPGGRYQPTIRKADFRSDVTNPWFPLPVGQTWVYAGTKDGEVAVDVVQVSSATKVIDGVTARVVNDRLLLNGALAERTSDYYAQDRCGNVWYFGEDTAELDAHGHVDNTDGSFHSGVSGAQPGVFMQADPKLGAVFRQEWFKGQAEDVYQALSKSAHRTVPYGAYSSRVLLTKEWTALEPDVVDNKYYVRGIGEIEELAVHGPTERLQLVDVLR